MLPIVTRAVGAALALAGLALAVVGVWFAVQLGGSGTATFTVSTDTTDVVVLRPDVLNRVDADVTITATPSDGGRVWMALANPSDATAVLGDSRHVEVTGVSVGDWSLLTATRGSGDPVDLTSAELWRNQDDAAGPVTMTVAQAEAPETAVITAEGGTLRSVTMTVSDKTWFVEAVVAALVGLFLLVVGLVVLWPRHRRGVGTAPTPDRAPVTDDSDGGDMPPEAPTDAERPDPTTTKEATP